MTISTFAELKTALNNADGFLHRQYTDTRLEELIAMAEARINRVLRVRQMETALSSTSISSGTITRPSDLVAVKALWSDTRGYPGIEQKSLEFVLHNHSDGSIPLYYAWERSSFRFNTDSGTVAGVYYASVPALSNSNATNWLLTARPDVYIACVKAEHAEYTERQDYPVLIGKAESLLEEMNTRDKQDRFSGNSLVVRAA